MKIVSSVIALSLAAAVSVPALASEPQPPTVAIPAAPHVQLAEAHAAGTLARYIVGPGGHVRGFTLRDGTVVMMRGQSGDAMAAEVGLGETVRVDGRSSPREPKVVFRAQVYGPHGAVTMPLGHKEHAHPDTERRSELRKQRAEALAKLPPTSVEGTVETVLTGRHGAPRTLLLSNGASVFLEPSLAHSLAPESIKPGAAIKVTGRGGSYKYGTSIMASDLTLAKP